MVALRHKDDISQILQRQLALLLKDDCNISANNSNSDLNFDGFITIEDYNIYTGNASAIGVEAISYEE